jgi:hypothetical protein
MLKAFDGHIFKPHGILTALPIEIGGKTVTIDVEVIDAPLDYNLLLGSTWFYAMKVVASTVFWLLSFPHQGKIITINQLDFYTPDLRPQANSSVPLISDSISTAQSIGTGLFKDPCLMGVFPLSTPDIPKIAPVNMIFFVGSYDPWVLPCPLEIDSFGDIMPLSPTELSYSAIQSAGQSVDTDHCPSFPRELDQYFLPHGAHPMSVAHDFLNDTLPSNESILEVLSLPERPWEDSHHHSSFPPSWPMDMASSHTHPWTAKSQLPSILSDIFSKGNLSTILETISIDTLVKHGVVEYIQIGADCSPEEIQLYTALFKEFCDVFT